MNMTLRRSAALAAALLLTLAALRPACATAPRFSAARLSDEAKPHLVAYEYPPLVTLNAAEPGAAVEIVRQAFALAGLTVAVEVVPSRSLAANRVVDDAQAVGMLADGWALGPGERASLIEERFLRLNGTYYFYRPARAAQMAQAADLDALKGYTYGALPGEPAERYAAAGIRVEVGEPKALLRKLKAGEVDFVSAFAPTGDRLIAKLFPNEPGDFATLPVAAWETSFALWFNGGHEPAGQWRRAFGEGLKRLIDSGAYAAILDRYGLDPKALGP